MCRYAINGLCAGPSSQVLTRVGVPNLLFFPAGHLVPLAVRAVRVASGGLAKDAGQDGDRDERDDYENDKSDDGDAQ